MAGPLFGGFIGLEGNIGCWVLGRAGAPPPPAPPAPTPLFLCSFHKYLENSSFCGLQYKNTLIVERCGS